MNEKHINLLHEQGILSHLDIHFGSFMTELAGGDNPYLFLAAALLSHFRGQGHICLDLASVEGTPLLTKKDAGVSVRCPELEAWKNSLEETEVVGRPGEFKPLILDTRSRLYLHRYWEYETKLATLIKNRIAARKTDLDTGLLMEGLNRLFPLVDNNGIDWQRITAFAALTRPFCVISGGPGTGKTTTVVKIIALILEQAGSEGVRIALAAPTGKAAARLQDAVNSEKGKLNCSDHILDAIPQEASTLHRLLGSIPGSPYFRYNAENNLPVDVVIVDEASMVDLALISKMVQALPIQARLILLGDKDQLASVEAGAVLGDICDSGNTHGYSGEFCRSVREIAGCEAISGSGETGNSGISDSIVQLMKSYRFGKDSGIGSASRAVNAGDIDVSTGFMKDDHYSDMVWKALPRPEDLPKAVRDEIVNGFEAYLNSADPQEALDLFDHFRILCALREGPYGVSTLNQLAERILKKAGLVKPDKTWYPGRPVLITRNDYNLRLFNGDVGIVLKDPESAGDLRVFFPGADGTMRKIHPLRLSEHETVFAMTVHKSQGSEFDHVLFILPDRDYPVLTRELIYTGMTRARKGIAIWGHEDVFRTAVSRRIERTSGLRDALWDT